MNKYRKFIVAAATVVVSVLVTKFDIDHAEAVQLVVAIAGAVGVYLAPNEL